MYDPSARALPVKGISLVKNRMCWITMSKKHTAQKALASARKCPFCIHMFRIVLTADFTQRAEGLFISHSGVYVMGRAPQVNYSLLCTAYSLLTGQRNRAYKQGCI